MTAPLKVKLRYYQKDAADAYEKYLKENATGNGVIDLPTASGKSYTLSEMIRRFAGNMRARILVATHSKKLVQQDYDSACKLWPEGKPLFGINSAGLKRRDYRKQVTFCGIQSVYNKAKMFGKDEEFKEDEKINFLIIDECFPSGTLVDNKPIESIKVGDVVTAYNEKTELLEKRKVTYFFKKPAPNEMVNISFGSKSLLCTKNHPIFTLRGWVNAEYLKIDDKIALHGVTNGKKEGYVESSSSMSHLREEVHTNTFASEQFKKRRWEKNILLNRVRKQIQSFYKWSTSFRIQQKEQKTYIGKNEEKQSDASRRNEKKSVGNTQENGMETKDSRWKWKTIIKTSKNVIRSLGVENGNVNSNKNGQKENRISISLQDRHRQQEFNDRDRSGRRESLHTEKKSPRQKENRTVEWARLDNIEIQESGSAGEPSELCPDGYVYNIEVEGLHTYTANGIVVHNCQRVNMETSVQYQKFIKDLLKINPKMRVCGLSATPFRMGSGLVYGPSKDLLFDDLVYKADTKELMAQGYLARPITPSIAKENRIDTNGVSIKKGDFVDADLDARVNIPTLIKSQVTETIKECKGLNSIAWFAVNIDHAENIAAELRARGESVAVVHSKIEEDDEKLLKKFEKTELRFMISVNMFVEGLDVANIQAIVDTKPTLSGGRYVQMYGRGFRLCPEIGKTKFLVLDFANNVGTHGPVDKVKPNPTGEKDGKAPKKQCGNPMCGMMCHARQRFCPYCGFEFPPPLIRDPEDKTFSKYGNQAVISEPKWFTVKRIECIESKNQHAISAQYFCKGAKFRIDILWDDSGKKWLKNHLGEQIPFDIKNFFSGGYRSKLIKPKKIFVDEAGLSSTILKYEFSDGETVVEPIVHEVKMEIRPEILLHPNIPKPLHGLNPRTLMGAQWWDIKRKESYAKNDFHCWACGVHKKDAVYHKWLEGHECYNIDYKKGTAEMTEVTALCHCCHNYIHSGRLLMMLESGKIDRDRYDYIIEHGKSITKDISDNQNPFIVDDSKIAEWSEWSLIIGNNVFKSKFKNFSEWQSFYNN